MSKEMISVPRELLEIVTGFVSSQADAFPLINVPRGLRSAGLDHVTAELRALLAKPAAESKPDPIIAVLKSNLADGVMPSFSGGDLKHLIKLLESASGPAAQPQGEPVADDEILQAMADHGSPNDERGTSTYDERQALAAGRAVLALYTRPAEQPAPVAVVTPVDPERERLIEIVEQYPNVDPLKYDAAVRTLRK
ncbi:hypothetical protein [Pseudomonas protegens]|uniref:hypothetical protein n=1 Tax=Pseudomonas protegens TaxID=380021 RepID=UPI00276DAC30|nr:hypothetical protein [Pseudomonas protegens]MDP9528553.1 hypothetical protein [Pseudomonas protegens]